MCPCPSRCGAGSTPLNIGLLARVQPAPCPSSTSLLCGTAAITGLVILHDDADYDFAACHLTDIQTLRVVPFPD